MFIFLQDGKFNCLPNNLRKNTIFPYLGDYKEIGFLPRSEFKMVFFEIDTNWSLFSLLKEITNKNNSFGAYEDIIFILNLKKKSNSKKTQINADEYQRNQENEKRNCFRLEEFDQFFFKNVDYKFELIKLLEDNQHLIFNFPYEFRKIEHDYKFIALNNFCFEINEFKKINKPNWTLRDLLETSYEINTVFKNEFEHFDCQLVESIIIQNLKSQLFDFGRYKDQALFTIILSDPNYINWCFKNINHFNIAYLFPTDWWHKHAEPIKESVILNESKRVLIEIFGIEHGNKIFDGSRIDYLDTLEPAPHDNNELEKMRFFSTMAEREGIKHLLF